MGNKQCRINPGEIWHEYIGFCFFVLCSVSCIFVNLASQVKDNLRDVSKLGASELHVECSDTGKKKDCHVKTEWRTALRAVAQGLEEEHVRIRVHCHMDTHTVRSEFDIAHHKGTIAASLLMIIQSLLDTLEHGGVGIP